VASAAAKTTHRIRFGARRRGVSIVLKVWGRAVIAGGA
jgi:hypothetical protein